ncbi:2Fe-2S iron-sulfur cluster-binding protein [Streptomyces sp. NPDC012746]|uniref:(2Fe-2S)-binding protein n=1 Tax=Streptomyces sp. NPDC012746 TaxID=3364845 RepID=UPI00367D45C5
MSENEIGNMSGGSGPTGQAEPAWGWEPVPHGGEYDSDATAFVKLPEDMLGAFGTGEPLAAPGHGYVPPPMIVPLGTATTDPSATGTWTMPVQWPEAGAEPSPAPSPAPVGGPIPASIPLPPSVSAAFAEPAAQGGEAEHDPGATAEWRFPEATHEPQEQGYESYEAQAQSHATGQWAMPASVTGNGALDADWSQAPATLPGGAAAPWATGHTGYEDARGYEEARGYAAGQPGAAEGDLSLTSGVLPGLADAARGFGGHGAGAPPRGPRVLGGPGVGTLPEGEPVHPAPHNIEAAHGAAAAPVLAERPHPGGEAAAGPAAAFAGGHGYAEMPAEAAEPAPAAFAGGHGFAEVAAEAAAEPGALEPEPGPGPEPEPEPLVGAGVGEPAGGEPVAAEAAGFDAAGLEPAGFEAEAAEAGAPAGAAVAAERGEHGFTGSGHAFAEDAESPTPTGDVPAGAETTPDAGSAGGFPAQDPTYDEEVTAPVAHHEHPSASYVLRVNGADRPVTGAWIGESLLYVLRERLGLAGAKDGCSQGECGACAVQVDGRLVASCLVPAATAAGSEVRTVEGLATDGELSDVQQALCRSGAVQCGFCVPGMAMTIHDLLEGNHAPSELETRQALCGNLCRCSGYTGVIDAVREVVAEREATAADADANAEAAASGTEPRIPHQAPPGEGGIHGANGAHGTHGTHGIQHNGGMA